MLGWRQILEVKCNNQIKEDVRAYSGRWYPGHPSSASSSVQRALPVVDGTKKKGHCFVGVEQVIPFDAPES